MSTLLPKRIQKAHQPVAAPAAPAVDTASQAWAPWPAADYIPSSPMRTTDAPSMELLPLPGDVPTQGSPAQGSSTFVSDPHHYATIVSSTVTPGAVATPDPQPFLVSPNTKRNLLMMRNASTGGQNIYVEFGKVASINTVLLLAPGGILYLDEVVPQDDLYAACDVAGGILAYGYSTISNP